MPDESTITEAAVSLPEADAARAKSTFNAEMATATAAENPPAQEAAPDKPAEPKADAAPAKPDMPAELLDGNKPDAEDPLLTGEAPKELKGAARANFEKLQTVSRERIAALKAEKEALTKQMTENKGDPEAVKARDAALEAHKAAVARAAELEAIVERSAFQNSSKYQALEKSEQAEMTAAKSYLDGTEIDPNVIDLASHAKGAARIKMLKDAGMEPETISAIAPHLAAIDRVSAEKTAALENSKAYTAQQIAEAEQQRAAQETQHKAEETRVFGEALSRAETTLKPFRRVEGNEPWNEQIAELKATAQSFFNGKADLATLADIAVKGVAYDVLDTMVGKQAATITELQAELGRLRAAQPSIEKVTEKNGSETPADPMARARSTFNRELAAATNGA